MIHFDSALLDSWIAVFFYPLARVSGLILAAPLFSHRSIPARVKVLLVVGLTTAIAPVAGEMPEAAPASGTGLVILAEQILIGVTLGFVMRLAFAAIDLAGELSGLQMGLGFATFFDPQNAQSSPVMAQLYGLLAMLFFLAINGHLLLVSLLAQSFSTLPVGMVMPGQMESITIVSYGARIFIAGLLLALPIVAALLAANFALGMLTRAAPQLNLFAVGFPATLLGGMMLILAVLPHILPHFETLFSEAAALALQWSRSVGR